MRVKTRYAASFILVGAILMLMSLTACGSDSGDSASSSTDGTTSREVVYPMFIEENSNGVNDYYEEATHDPGSSALVRSMATNSHNFMDQDGDSVCDYAQNGSGTWHGPGFVDENANGICDYWEEGMPMYQQNYGMHFSDENMNHVNDFMESQGHAGNGHGFVDTDEDGVCDFAQDGGTSWHGPNFQDEDGDGVSDHWQDGGMGHGSMMENDDGMGMGGPNFQDENGDGGSDNGQESGMEDESMMGNNGGMGMSS